MKLESRFCLNHNSNNNNNNNSIAKAGNELHRRKQKRKATEKEKKILKDLKQQPEESDTTSKNIRRYKEKWLDQLRYKKMKLEKMIERGNRIKDNANFEKDQKAFFKTLEAKTVYEGEPPWMEKFVEFSAGIWEKDENHQKCHGWRKLR